MSKTYALITGASSGIGLEIARQLAARRMHLTLVARSGDVLEEVARELTERFGVDVRTAALDLSESDGWGKLERLIEEDERELTLLVNNAGVGAFGSALDVPEERVRTMLRLNIEAVTRLTLFCAKRFRERGHGRILNIASTGAFQPCPWLAVYGATKPLACGLRRHEGLRALLQRSPFRGTEGDGRHRNCLLPGSHAHELRHRGGARRGLSL